MAMIECSRFAGQIHLLRSAYRSGKRWIVFDESDSNNDKLSFANCFAEATEQCTKQGNTNLKIGELGCLLRIVSPVPKWPYQWSEAVPLFIHRTVHCLTAISYYEVVIGHGKIQPVNFYDFSSAYRHFEKCVAKKKQVTLSANWKRHPLGEKSSVLYQTFTGRDGILQMLDPCEELHLKITFFERKHVSRNEVAYYDSCLRKVRRLDFGKKLDTSLFCEFEKT